MDTNAPTTPNRPARIAGADLPWVPSPVPGKSARPLQFLSGNRGFVELLRMEPGLVMPPHRHTGETHVYMLAGRRRLCSGEVVGPGDYVYEPPGNVDSWEVIGDEAAVAFVVVMGEVEMLDTGGEVRGRASAAGQLSEYVRHCQARKLPVSDLVER